MVKVYGALWLAVVLVAALILVIGYMTWTVVVAFGFVIFGLVFMGMMGVLPATIAHPAGHELTARIEEVEPAVTRRVVRQTQTSAHA